MREGKKINLRVTALGKVKFLDRFSLCSLALLELTHRLNQLVSTVKLVISTGNSFRDKGTKERKDKLSVWSKVEFYFPNKKN